MTLNLFYQEAVCGLSQQHHCVIHTSTPSKMQTVALQRNSSSSHSSDDTELLSQTGFTILAVIMGVFSAAGIILNVLVIVVTGRHRQLRQPLSYALVNLAVCDLGCAVFGGLPTTVTSAMGYFSLGRVGCVLEGFAVAFFGESAAFFIFVQKRSLHVSCTTWYNLTRTVNITFIS